ncbi:hypothetical protein MRB53_040743 [Persea americana]|nr:hypothetical protein MRB53_040743 [Persea americana]
MCRKRVVVDGRSPGARCCRPRRVRLQRCDNSGTEAPSHSYVCHHVQRKQTCCASWAGVTCASTRVYPRRGVKSRSEVWEVKKESGLWVSGALVWRKCWLRRSETGIEVGRSHDGTVEAVPR